MGIDWNEILDRLKADRGNWSRIAEATGLSGNQIRRIVHGETKSPRVETAKKIADYYTAQDDHHRSGTELARV